ncbi:MAG: hypothetical protein LKG49_04215 [Lactobacillus sp.]|nr:hypothetical protein [Lactobacillus sp.]
MIGGVFKKEDQTGNEYEKLSDLDNSIQHIRVKKQIYTLDFYIEQDLIYQIDISSSVLSIANDSEEINGLIRDALPKDASELKKQSKNCYKCYSDKQDRYYDVIINTNESTLNIIISGIEAINFR